MDGGAALVTSPDAEAPPAPARGPQFLFVLEQTQGHVAHSRNLVRRALSDGRFQADLIYVRQPTGRSLSQRLPLLRSWSMQASLIARAALKRHVRDRSPDGLLIHTQVAALLAADIMRIVPTVISMDATPKNYDELRAYEHERHPAAVERIKAGINSRAFRAARALAPWSRWAADSLVRDYHIPPSSVHVIRPGVDLTLFRPRTGARRPGPVRILFVGGDFKRKGGPELIKAAAGFGQRVELHLVTKSDVEASTGEMRCHVHRDVDPQAPRLLELLHEADLFVLPTKAECYGIAITEAMACGLPIISSPVGAIPELVRDGVNGYLVEPTATADLKGAIAKLVDEPDLREAMGRESLAIAHREHDVDASFKSIIDLLFEIRRPA